MGGGVRWLVPGLVAAALTTAGCDDLLQAGRAAFAPSPADSVAAVAAAAEEAEADGGAARAGRRDRPPAELLGRPAWEGTRSAIADDLQSIFEDEGVEGVIVVHDLRSGATLRSDEARAGRRATPASTFKILHALIALETGVVAGASDTIRWDGVDRGSDGWNRDHDLRSAFRTSAVWYFQELARRIGLERMEGWVRRAGYGNADVSGPIDAFWLEGPLAISPDEQIGFLRRLRAGHLPFSTRSMDVARDLMVLERSDDWTLRGKTGWAREGLVDDVWFVGWVDRGEETAFFVIEFENRNPNRDVGTMRERIYKRALTQLGLVSAQGR